MHISRYIIASALLGMASGATADSVSVQSLEASDYTLSIQGGDLGLFPLLQDSTNNRVLRYRTGDGVIELNPGQDSASRFLNPLACFQFGDAPTVGIELIDVNGAIVASGLGFSSALRYQPDPINPAINLMPASGSHCFYRGDTTGVFGLFGQPVDDGTPNEQLIFHDRFEPDEAISIRFEDLPAFANPNDLISYRIIVSNTGSVALSGIALQELLPRASGGFDAVVSSPIWNCSGPSGLCPSNDSQSHLRFENLSLGVGQSLTFNVSRFVDGDALSGATLDFYAATTTGSRWDTAETSVIVIGEGESLSAASDGGIAGVNFEIEVTALDINNNPVPFIEITVEDADGLTFTSLSETTTFETGSAIFLASAETAASYQPVFSAVDLGNASVTVNVSAADPDSVTASAIVPQGIADGSAPAVIALTVIDTFSNPVPAIEVVVLDDGGASNVTTATPFTDSNGVASFQVFSTTAGSILVELGVAGVGSDTVSVDFVAGSPADIQFVTVPSEVVEEELFDVVIEVVDSEGNRVISDSDTEVTLSLRQNGSTVTGYGFASADEGLVTFTGLSVATAGSNYSIRAVATDDEDFLVQQDSAPFTVTEAGP